ncbi:MAG: chemotaxis-specific protein-glutamate methyltransferase CheB [Muribaculum sp.]|nr:chemotaxis-specific protein-glutamate methyltransferase CheB [Muribaculum sp.]
MRRIICDIIGSDKRFEVADMAMNGVEALELLGKNSYDAVVMDISMPKMDGIQLLKELRKARIRARVMVVSSHTYEGAKITMDALMLGALDFLQKPGTRADWDTAQFHEKFLQTLEIVSNGSYPDFGASAENFSGEKGSSAQAVIRPRTLAAAGSRIVALASSTGGPRALQSVIPRLPKDLDAPVLLVQHMPKGFTKSLAERLDQLSEITVKEAEEGEEIRKGVVYLAMGGMHMTAKRTAGDRYVIRYTDEPPREGVKPSANYMFESLIDSGFDRIICAVMTGMGADGTEGIRALKAAKNTYVIAQDKETSTVYGMPMHVKAAGLSDIEAGLDRIAQEIVRNIGVRNA